jgi:hypothetical protein
LFDFAYYCIICGHYNDDGDCLNKICFDCEDTPEAKRKYELIELKKELSDLEKNVSFMDVSAMDLMIFSRKLIKKLEELETEKGREKK